MSYVIYRRTFALAALLTLAVSAHAGTPAVQANDLGQSWPRAQNVSISAGWNVYIFTRDGVRYIQVNDASGIVRAAFAAANGQTLVMPIGTDAAFVSVLKPSQAPSFAANSVVVYRDSQLTLSMTPQADGTSWQVALSTTAPINLLNTKSSVMPADECDSRPACGNHVLAQSAMP